jgi:GH25 family lysozyme M1 (1,4-beta-N-acetylmuramidase)
MLMDEIQRILKVLGLYNAEPTGEHDEATKEAVCKFQELCGIDVDGSPSPATIKELQAVSGTTPTKAQVNATPDHATPTQDAGFVPRVVDLYHGDKVNDFAPAAAAGVWGVIHKATQGVLMADSLYKTRRDLAKKAGLLWGAYHFNSGDDVNAQVERFMKNAQPDDNTLMVLDYESNVHSPMSIQQAVEFSSHP